MSNIQLEMHKYGNTSSPSSTNESKKYLHFLKSCASTSEKRNAINDFLVEGRQVNISI